MESYAESNTRAGATISAGAQLGAARPMRPLEAVGTAAERIAKVNSRLVDLLDRFHGPQPQPAPNGNDALVVSYIGQINRLGGNIDTLENLINALSEVA